MDISSLTGLTPTFGADTTLGEREGLQSDGGKGFGPILQSAMDLLQETNQLQKQSEQEELQFAMGLSQNTHDLKIAQEKASVALQYTVTVRDKVMEAYREIMNMQI